MADCRGSSAAAVRRAPAGRLRDRPGRDSRDIAASRTRDNTFLHSVPSISKVVYATKAKASVEGKLGKARTSGLGGTRLPRWGTVTVTTVGVGPQTRHSVVMTVNPGGGFPLFPQEGAVSVAAAVSVMMYVTFSQPVGQIWGMTVGYVCAAALPCSPLSVCHISCCWAWQACWFGMQSVAVMCSKTT